MEELAKNIASIKEELEEIEAQMDNYLKELGL